MIIVAINGRRWKKLKHCLPCLHLIVAINHAVKKKKSNIITFSHLPSFDSANKPCNEKNTFLIWFQSISFSHLHARKQLCKIPWNEREKKTYIGWFNDNWSFVVQTTFLIFFLHFITFFHVLHLFSGISIHQSFVSSHSECSIYIGFDILILTSISKLSKPYIMPISFVQKKAICKPIW